MKTKIALCLMALSPLAATAGGTFVVNYTFPSVSGAGSTGAYPDWELSRKPGSTDMYGVSPKGGTSGGGTLYRIGTSGELTVLRHFGASGDINGSQPGGPVLHRSGYVYGVTSTGGANNTGVLYRWHPTSGYKRLYSFGSGTAGAAPSGQLLLASDGNIYGVTKAGGTCGNGTVYRYVIATGQVANVHSFCGLEGGSPLTGVIQATNGDLYGTAYNGGVYGGGTLYRLSLAGAFSQIHAFGAASGPRAPSRLTQGKDGLLYGTSWGGGFMDGGTVFSSSLTGAVSMRAELTRAPMSPANPSMNAALLERFTGVFYGVTYANGGGTVFQFRASNRSVSLIHTFDGWSPGFPLGGLAIGPDGNLWGTTTDGALPNFPRYGAIYSIQNLVANP
jgi:uncharacterized repeat protein (TIGR03803 family)